MKQENLTQALQLTSYAQASVLKELGFDWPVPDHFHENLEHQICTSREEPDNYNGDDWGQDYVSCPAIALVFKWLRKVHHIHVHTYPNAGKDGYNISIEKTLIEFKEDCPFHVRSYEDNDLAESMALNVVLEYMIKKKTHSIRIEIQEKKEEMADILKVGNTVFFSQSEEYWDRPYVKKRHHFFDVKTVVLRGKVTDIDGDEFKAILIENNDFERDGKEYIFHRGQLLSNQNFTDFDQLGKWKKDKSNSKT